jgi:hypothetical protein
MAANIAAYVLMCNRMEMGLFSVNFTIFLEPDGGKAFENQRIETEIKIYCISPAVSTKDRRLQPPNKGN